MMNWLKKNKKVSSPVFVVIVVLCGVALVDYHTNMVVDADGKWIVLGGSETTGYNELLESTKSQMAKNFGDEFLGSYDFACAISKELAGFSCHITMISGYIRGEEIHAVGNTVTLYFDNNLDYVGMWSQGYGKFGNEHTSEIISGKGGV